MTPDPIVVYLFARRIELGLAVREVARRSGLSESAISEGERGNRGVHMDTVRRWCRGLDVDILPVPAPRPLYVGMAMAYRKGGRSHLVNMVERFDTHDLRRLAVVNHGQLGYGPYVGIDDVRVFLTAEEG
jgi:transcriptional regulator with XRE-family HTH domain